MARSNREPRVAIVVMGRGAHEDQVVRGAITYHKDKGSWRLAGEPGRLFLSIEQIDLTRVDGVVGNFFEQLWVDTVSRARIQAVNTSNWIADVSLPRVVNDDEAIGRMGAKYLMGRGFAHFGFLTAGDAWYSKCRLHGFREVVERNSSIRCHVSEGPGFETFRAEPIAGWLRDLPKPIAIMAANDIRASELIQAALELELRVPEDVAVLGVDNDEWIAALSPVGLSSIHIDSFQVGYRAAQLLDQLMAGQTPPTKPLKIPPLSVVTRRSTDIVISEDELVARVLRYIQDHCMQNLNVDDLLNETGVSRRKLEMRMKLAIGQTPREAITRAQVERAKTILSRSNVSMSEVSEMCGFAQPNHFSTVFKRITGMTPGQYRQHRMIQLGHD